MEFLTARLLPSFSASVARNVKETIPTVYNYNLPHFFKKHGICGDRCARGRMCSMYYMRTGRLSARNNKNANHKINKPKRRDQLRTHYFTALRWSIGRRSAVYTYTTRNGHTIDINTAGMLI